MKHIHTPVPAIIFVNSLKGRHYIHLSPSCSALEEAMLSLKGSEVTVSYFEKNGFSRPILVSSKEGLGMKVPSPDFQVADVERCVGMYTYTHACTHTYIRSYMSLIGVHELHGRIHPN